MNTHGAVLISAGILGLLVVLAIAIRMRSSGMSSWPFYQKRPMTQAEQMLYFRLVKALPDHLVLAKVHLESFLGVKKGYRASSWSRRIGRSSVDFLVCTRDATIVVAIDLDGKTPETPKRQAENRRKDLALASAGIKLVRWHVRSMPTETAIRDMLIQPVRYVEPIDRQHPTSATTQPARGWERTSYASLSHPESPVAN